MDQNTKKMADELAHDRAYIQSVTEELQKMSTSIVEMQKLFSQFANIILTQFAEPKPEGKTEDIEQIIPVEEPVKTDKKETPEVTYKLLVPQKDDVVIQGNKCIQGSVKEFSEHIQDYNVYSTRPATKYKANVAISTITLLEMIKSQTDWLSKTPTETEANVWVVMRPMNVTDGTLYPRFLMNCKTHQPSEKVFKQRCQLLANKPHYSLDNFSFLMFVQSGTKHCKSTETLVSYQILLRGNEPQILAIKSAALKPAGIFAKPLGVFFNTEKFFKNYYKNFIDETVRLF